MRTATAMAALPLLLVPALATALVKDEYVPVHKRFSYSRQMNDFAFLGMLSKRDECSDAFGPDASNSNCAPDFTLCCTRRAQAFPSCQQLLDKGWCCVGDGDEDNCYVDQESACGEAGAVACTNLAEGVEEACCPRLTSCDASTEAREGFVRCNINRRDLLVANSAAVEATRTTTQETTSSTTTSEAESTTTSAPTTTESTSPTETSDPNAAESQNNGGGGTNAGAIAGGVVGGIAALAAIGFLVWFFMRRRAKYQAANQEPQPSIPQFYQDQAAKYQQPQQGYYPQQSASPYQDSHYQPPSELATQEPSELGGGERPVELDTHYR